ncbi:MAG: lipoyl synthase [Ardenticatenales bacterium]|nr:lipoyl synthase [Ardenticatenales bacterium]
MELNVTIFDQPPVLPSTETRGPKPPWLKVRAPGGSNYRDVSKLIEEHRLHTVCAEARCPNIGECWENRTATFMLLGDTCTRGCRFCAVTKGKPSAGIDWDEPERCARAIQTLGLRHAVITSVNRDDQPDGGAVIFALLIRRVRELGPETRIEVLTPDFMGNLSAVRTVAEAGPDIFNHNTETVPRLYPRVRPKAKFVQSMQVLRHAKQSGRPSMMTKSGIMVGLGETVEEVIQVMVSLREAECDIMTIGQYLRPSPWHLPVQRYVRPEEFAEFKRIGLGMGFRHVESGPLVRSSYHAHEQTDEAHKREPNVVFAPG